MNFSKNGIIHIMEFSNTLPAQKHTISLTASNVLGGRVL
jgi:hypothetical protein